MNKLSPRQQVACDLAERQLCRDWLLYIMAASSGKQRTKADLRDETIERFGVSKSTFDFAWIWAIEETGNRHCYDPLPRSRRKTTRTRLTWCRPVLYRFHGLQSLEVTRPADDHQGELFGFGYILAAGSFRR